MKLPNANAAILSPEKFCDYLLSPVHPIGRYKAAFFRSQGYRREQWESLASDIRSIVTNDAILVETTSFGTKYKIHGTITGPSNRMFDITTIWIILNSEEQPRLVTAYPEEYS